MQCILRLAAAHTCAPPRPPRLSGSHHWPPQQSARPSRPQCRGAPSPPPPKSGQGARHRSCHPCPAQAQARGLGSLVGSAQRKQRAAPEGGAQRQAVHCAAAGCGCAVAGRRNRLIWTTADLPDFDLKAVKTGGSASVLPEPTRH